MTEFCLWPESGKATPHNRFTVHDLNESLENLSAYVEKTFILCSTCYSGGIHQIAKKLKNVVTVATSLERMISLDPRNMSCSFAFRFFERFFDSLSARLSFSQAAYAAAYLTVGQNPGLSRTSSSDFLNECLGVAEYHQELKKLSVSKIERFDNQTEGCITKYIPPDTFFRKFSSSPALVESQWPEAFLSGDLSEEGILLGKIHVLEDVVLCPMIDQGFLDLTRSLAKLEAKKNPAFSRKLIEFVSASAKKKRLAKLSQDFEKKLQTYFAIYTGKLTRVEEKVKSLLKDNYSDAIQKWLGHLEKHLRISCQLISHYFKNGLSDGSHFFIFCTGLASSAGRFCA